MSWWLFYWCLLSAQASEMVLRYTTDLTTSPRLDVEMVGRTESVSARKVKSRPPFYEWEMRWDSEGAWVQQLHLHHSNRDESFSVVLVGPQQQGTVYLLNDYRTYRRQLLSDVGEVQAIIANENRTFRHHAMWMGCVILVLLLVRRSRIAESDSSQSPSFIWWQHPLSTGGIFLLLSIWWQRSMLFTSGIPAQYHDALGTYWLMARAVTWDGLLDPMTAHPIGGNYQSLDSFLLWGIARVFVWLDPVWLYRGCLILFPALSAWVAEWWARELDIRTPWSLVAGMLFGFSGLVENAILEGQVYQCLTLGLPLTGIFVGRYLREPRWQNWLGVIGGFSLSIFSSSYLGASCLILLFGWWIGTGSWRRLNSVWIFLGVLPILWLHKELMSTAGIHQVRELQEMVIGSVSLTNFWGSTPELDREGHAIALGVSIVGLVLTTLVHRGQLPKASWNSIFWMGGVSLMLMVGPTLNMSHLDKVLSLPNTWLYQQSGFSSIGFPIRLAHPFLLGVAILAALCTQQMAKRYRWTWLILPLIWADVERRNLSERQGFWSSEVPSLNNVEPEESVFTLYPLAYKRLKGSDADIILYMLDCMAQVGHEQPITNNCLSVNIQTSQNKQIQEALLNQILERGSVTEIMRQHQLDVIVMYPELFSPTDRIRVQQALKMEATLIEEGQTPLWYQVYRPAEIPQTVITQYVPSEVTIDLITSKDESKPLLVIGNGVLMETSTQVHEQTVRHQVHLSDQPASFSLLFQNTSGETVWEGTLYPRSETDRFVVRPELGPQMELPIFSSPPALSTETQWVWLLFGGLLGSWLFVRRKDELDAVM